MRKRTPEALASLMRLLGGRLSNTTHLFPSHRARQEEGERGKGKGSTDEAATKGSVVGGYCVFVIGMRPGVTFV